MVDKIVPPALKLWLAFIFIFRSHCGFCRGNDSGLVDHTGRGPYPYRTAGTHSPI